MDRRDFLLGLFGAGVVAATPKLIFDMGKNSRLYAPVTEEIKFYETGYAVGAIAAYQAYRAYQIMQIQGLYIGDPSIKLFSPEQLKSLTLTPALSSLDKLN